MTVKRLVSGKHPITIRLTEEDYGKIKHLAADENLSVNEWIVEKARNAARDESKVQVKE